MNTAAFSTSRDFLPSDIKAGLRVPFVAFGCCNCGGRARVSGTVAGFWRQNGGRPLLWLDVDGVRRVVRHDVDRLGVVGTCSKCGTGTACFPIEARVSEHVCGSACRHAKGGSCDCSCGGEFHGAGD